MVMASMGTFPRTAYSISLTQGFIVSTVRPLARRGELVRRRTGMAKRATLRRLMPLIFLHLKTPETVSAKNIEESQNGGVGSNEFFDVRNNHESSNLTARMSPAHRTGPNLH